MFRIYLNDVGSECVTRSFVTPVETLPEAEIVAKEDAEKCLSTGMADFVYVGDLVYGVYSDMDYEGVVKIRALN